MEIDRRSLERIGQSAPVENLSLHRRVTLTLTRREELVEAYAIKNESEEVIGCIKLAFFPSTNKMYIASIGILPIFRGQGYGRASYEEAASKRFRDNIEYDFISSPYLSEDAKHVWKSLVSRGKALEGVPNQYKMLFAEQPR